MIVYRTLASLDFAGKLYEAQVQTQTGRQLINKYQAYCISNPTSCKIVNSFMKEAKSCLYDSGVASVYEAIANTITDNKYSWALASACELIREDSSKGNYLNRRAAEQVAPMLEMKERDIVDYIKSGALKSVMYVESFRNIAKSVYADQPVVESNKQYTVVHPVSIVEQKEDVVYFNILGSIYKIENDTITEAKEDEVSRDFIYMNQLLDSNSIALEGDALKLSIGNRVYIAERSGECILKANDRDLVLTVEQLRENSLGYVQTLAYNSKNAASSILESFTKIVENFDNLCVLNNASIVYSANDQFMIIEHNGRAYAKMLKTNHTHAWRVEDNIAKVCESIKKYTHVDVSDQYAESIGTVLEQVSAEEGQQITESLERDRMLERKRKIAELTERYKSDPVRLHMLSQIAADLNDME